MSRKSLTEEMKNREAVDKLIVRGARQVAYMPPPYLVGRLTKLGINVTRQLISRRYGELGIVWDEETGLWKMQEKK